MNARFDSLCHPVKRTPCVTSIEACSRNEHVSRIHRRLDRRPWWTQRSEDVAEGGPRLTLRIQAGVRKTLSHSVANCFVYVVSLPVVILQQGHDESVSTVRRFRPGPAGFALRQAHDEEPRPVLGEPEVGRIQQRVIDPVLVVLAWLRLALVIVLREHMIR